MVFFLELWNIISKRAESFAETQERCINYQITGREMGVQEQFYLK